MKPVLKYILYIIWGIFVIWFWIKLSSGSCKGAAADFKNNYQCHLILQKKVAGSGLVTLYGIDLDSHRETKVVDGSRTFSSGWDSIRVGDTIVKNKGEYKVLIKRYGKIIPLYFECENHIYKD